jgi:hypothetical protein
MHNILITKAWLEILIHAGLTDNYKAVLGENSYSWNSISNSLKGIFDLKQSTCIPNDGEGEGEG